jgi:hypothetical protein
MSWLSGLCTRRDKKRTEDSSLKKLAEHSFDFLVVALVVGS